MDFKYHLEKAWGLTLQYIVPLIILTLAAGAVSAISFGILAMVVWAGYVQSVLLMVRSGREPKIQDLFSEMRLFLPLLGFSIVVAVVLMIGFALLVLPGIVMSFAVGWACLYMVPLMTDRQYGLIDAAKESFRIVSDKENLMDQLVVAILFIGISAIGSSVFIGWLFTQPLATIFLVSVYEDKVAKAGPPSPTGPPPSPPKEPDMDNLQQK